ncbi:SseB family protein [Microbacterium sp. P02]|uniref:SseB family protein n=1 Tax=unclassified Microbacterium TaxID=2609290 RepID=UPI003672CCD4
MALFSRGKRAADQATTPDSNGSEATETDAAATPATESPLTGGAGGGEASVATPTEDLPTVGISMSSFQGVGAAPAETPAAPSTPAPRPAQATPRTLAPAEAPEAKETVPGLRDNALLRQALAALSDTPAPPDVANVARQLLQGSVFLRVHGDARTLLAEGQDLPLAIATQGDAQFVLVFSGGEPLQASVRADGQTDTSAMGQPVLAVIRHVLDGPFAGMILDHASVPGRVLLPRQLLQRAVDEADPELTVKSILAAPRTEATASEIVAALPTAKLWIAAGKPEGSDAFGIAESRTPEGDRYLEVFSHPLEIVALGRSDSPLPVTAAQLGGALKSDEGISGLLVDPAGPWIRLQRDDLLPVIALAG